MKIREMPRLDINHLHDNCKKYSHIYPEKTEILTDFYRFKVLELQVGLNAPQITCVTFAEPLIMYSGSFRIG
jgi:hypothetical protein